MLVRLNVTSGSRRKQRWNRSADVQDRGAEPASAASPAHPGKPEHPSLPSSSAPPTHFHLHPHYLNHAVVSRARRTWCLDPEYSSKTISDVTWMSLTVQNVNLISKLHLKLTFIAVLSVSSLSCNFFSLCLAFLASLSAALLGTKKRMLQLIGTTNLQQQQNRY